MSSGSKKQTVGYWYRILGHYGLSKGPVDAFLELRGGDRTAWKGLLQASGRIHVAAKNLWGGKKSEGGLEGDMDLMFGEADQAPNDYLTANLGEQPAYRGKFTAVWRGGIYGAMNPYPKTLAFKFRRILKGWDNDTPWYPEKAPIPLVPAEPMALYFALDISGSMADITPNGQSRLANMKSAIVAALQVISDVVLSTDAEVDVMVVGFGTQPSTRTSLMRRRCSKADIADLQAFVNGLSSGLWTYFPAGLIDMPAFFSGAPTDSKQMVFFCTDGLPTTSDSSMTAEQIAGAAGDLVAAQAGVSVYAMNIDLADTTYTAYVDNTPDDGVPVIAGDNPDAITNVIISGLGGLIGMNPIHILYDSLTARDMQAEPVGLINDASFRAAADKCFAEGLGLCTTYVPDDEDIESFQQRICDVIGANLTQSRVDGQYYVDLIRGDYDFATLPILTSDDVMEFSQEPTNLNEVTNQIIVQWFDPQNKEDRTTQPIQAMGAIMAAGGVSSETKTYRELPTEGLALRVGARDLQAKATPLSRFDLTTNRRPWKWRPGNYFRLQLPEEGIADMVCIVGEIDTGTHIDGRCRLKAVQDVFAFPDTVYVQPEPGLAEPEDPHPAASPHQVVLEAPYVELITSLSNADMAAFPEDAGALLTIASRSSNGLNYSIYSAGEGESLADNGTAEWCPSAAIVAAAGYLDTAFTFIDDNDLSNVALGSWALWDSEIVRVDALDLTARTVAVGRGCADTVPVQHAAGSRLFFCGDWVGTDGREYVGGETVTAKLLSRTSSDEQPLADAPLLSVEMGQRQIRPYAPAQFKINGLLYPTWIGSTSATLTWVPRDRLLQADKLIDTSQAAMGPEPGTTYTVRVLNADQSLVSEFTELASTSQEVSLVAVTTPTAILELLSVRDGLESFQRHSFNLAFQRIVIDSINLAAVQGSAYSRSIPVSAGTAPYTFSLFSGSLPAGLALSSDGTISGTPTTIQSTTFTIQVVDSIGQIGQRTYTMKVGKLAALLKFEGANGSTTFTDDTGKVWSKTGNAAITTSTAAAGSGSLLLDGSTSSISTPDNADFSFGTDDFTIEAFVNMAAWPASSGTVFIVGQRITGSSSNAWSLAFGNYSSGFLTFRFSAGPTSDTIIISKAIALADYPTGTWGAFAVSRKDGVFRLFFNGVQVAEVTDQTTLSLFDSTAVVRAGAINSTATGFLNGKLDQMRIVKGAALRWDAYDPHDY